MEITRDIEEKTLVSRYHGPSGQSVTICLFTNTVNASDRTIPTTERTSAGRFLKLSAMICKSLGSIRADNGNVFARFE